MAVPRDWGDLPQEEPPRWAAPGRRWERAPLFAGSARIDACGWEVWHLTDLYREDDSAIRTRSGPRGMAALRNLAIGALHQAGAATPPKPPAGPAATWTALSPFSG